MIEGVMMYDLKNPRVDTWKAHLGYPSLDTIIFVSLRFVFCSHFTMQENTQCANCDYSWSKTKDTKGENKPSRRCGGCRMLSYCGVSCQKKHWKQHKAQCKHIMGLMQDTKIREDSKHTKKIVQKLIQAFALPELTTVHRLFFTTAFQWSLIDHYCLVECFAPLQIPTVETFAKLLVMLPKAMANLQIDQYSTIANSTNVQNVQNNIILCFNRISRDAFFEKLSVSNSQSAQSSQGRLYYIFAGARVSGGTCWSRCMSTRYFKPNDLVTLQKATESNPRLKVFSVQSHH